MRAGLGIWRRSRKRAARASRAAAEMNSQSDSRQQHLRREPPQVTDVAAKVAINSMVEDMQRPSHKEASQGDCQRVVVPAMCRLRMANVGLI